MYLGYLAAFGFIFLLIIGIYCFGYAARKASLLSILFIETIFGLTILLPMLIIGNELSFKELILKPNVHHYVWLFNAALLGFAGGNYFSLLNLKTAGEKINSLLSPAITAMTIVLSSIVFREKLKITQWIGIVLTLLVIFKFLLFNKKIEINNIKISSVGRWSSIGTIGCIALSIICSIKGASDTISFIHAIIIRLFFALLIILAVIFVKNEFKLVTRQSSKFYLIIVLGVLAQTIGASYLWYYATFSIGISVLQVIIASLPLWVYAIDIYILRKSKASINFLITAVLAGFGIYLVMH